MAAYLFLPGKSETPESQYLAYCSGCYLAPNPAHIPRPVWEDRILPEMAARLGYKYSNYDPMAKNSFNESFVFLENKNQRQYLFEPHTFQEARLGRWLVMDKGDFDQDGDVDLLLGSFIRLSPGREFQAVTSRWRKEKVDVLLLENTARD